MRNLGLLTPAAGVAGAFYHRALTDVVQSGLGPDHPPALLTLSIPDSDQFSVESGTDELAHQLKIYARKVKRAGPQRLMLGSTTWYRHCDDLGWPLPLFHPIDALECEMRHCGLSDQSSIGFVAPLIAASPGSFMARLVGARSRSILLPAQSDLQLLTAICRDVNRGAAARSTARCDVLRIIHDLRIAGADAIVVGAEELAVLFETENVAADCFILPQIHAAAAAAWMVGDGVAEYSYQKG